MRFKRLRALGANSSAHTLVRSSVEGNTDAQLELARQLEPIVRRAVGSVAASGGRGSAERVDDLAQEVLLSLFAEDCRKLRQFEGRNGCSLAGWVNVVAVRLAIDRLRAEARRGGVGRDGTISPQGLEGLPAHEAGPEEVASGRERLRLVDSVLEQMSSEDRALADLHFGRGLKMEEVAVVLGTSVNALYIRKSRLLRRIRRALEEHEQ